MADADSLLRRRRQALEDVSWARFRVCLQMLAGSFWVVLAAVRWTEDDGSVWLDWVWTVLSLVYFGAGLALWRRFRRERARLATLVGIDLRPVTETTLSRLVTAATDGTAAGEVTPSITPGEGWTAERIEWLRAFHRERRAGLDGPAQEATWAVVEVVDDEGRGSGRVVGAVRLRRAGGPGVLELGIWLVRHARGRGVGREAVGLALERAREAGATAVRAETTSGNDGALTVLRASGFATAVDGERVVAERELRS
ncbi:GNAT family N-acetyltransferase [Blastococcus capsensis]|uniref:GNAT family N-acetyltransferase n=1 Tax=Blastococcus capsensis TaxID=1564163 RepID=UPI002541011E|nr:GNAT family N-acetyltransferase [Blastococcus capsensis]MDK3258412.1 GNAT family N-acetyltransferase [Blastococcus capsensis]